MWLVGEPGWGVREVCSGGGRTFHPTIAPLSPGPLSQPPISSKLILSSSPNQLSSHTLSFSPASALSVGSKTDVLPSPILRPPFLSLPSCPVHYFPSSTRPNGPNRFGFIEFKWAEDAEDAYYEMYVSFRTPSQNQTSNPTRGWTDLPDIVRHGRSIEGYRVTVDVRPAPPSPFTFLTS